MITDIWRHQPGEYFCIARKIKPRVFVPHFFTRDRWDKAEAFVERCAKSARLTQEGALWL